jgi:hypothetical protein
MVEKTRSACLFCDKHDTETNPHIVREDKPRVRICLQCAETAWWAGQKLVNPEIANALLERARARLTSGGTM